MARITRRGFLRGAVQLAISAAVTSCKTGSEATATVPPATAVPTATTVPPTQTPAATATPTAVAATPTVKVESKIRVEEAVNLKPGSGAGGKIEASAGTLKAKIEEVFGKDAVLFVGKEGNGLAGPLPATSPWEAQFFTGVAATAPPTIEIKGQGQVSYVREEGGFAVYQSASGGKKFALPLEFILGPESGQPQAACWVDVAGKKKLVFIDNGGNVVVSKDAVDHSVVEIKAANAGGWVVGVDNLRYEYEKETGRFGRRLYWADANIGNGNYNPGISGGKLEIVDCESGRWRGKVWQASRLVGPTPPDKYNVGDHNNRAYINVNPLADGITVKYDLTRVGAFELEVFLDRLENVWPARPAKAEPWVYVAGIFSSVGFSTADYVNPFNVFLIPTKLIQKRPYLAIPKGDGKGGTLSVVGFVQGTTGGLLQFNPTAPSEFSLKTWHKLSLESVPARDGDEAHWLVRFNGGVTGRGVPTPADDKPNIYRIMAGHGPIYNGLFPPEAVEVWRIGNLQVAKQFIESVV